MMPETTPSPPSLQRAAKALQAFVRTEAAGGVLLLVAGLLALAFANSSQAGAYHSIWDKHITLRLGPFGLRPTIHFIINDVLMVLFFFVIGLELKVELKQGSLSAWKSAALPTAAALGGMAAPALLYLAVAGAPETRSGWGVPVATDIAFALGALTILGNRVPHTVRVLLLALAVVDDVGAIVVIAAFYSGTISLFGLGIAAGGFALVGTARWLGVRTVAAYVLPGFVVWLGVYKANLHPTLAGVALGLVTPVNSWRDRFGREHPGPADHLIDRFHPWVTFVVMPLFGFANAGVSLESGLQATNEVRVAVAVGLGLVVGKPLGILGAIWVCLKLRLGSLAPTATVRGLVVLAITGGIGFTMALFIAQLAFVDARLLAAAKTGVLGGSAVAAVLAVVTGRLILGAPKRPGS